MVACGVTRRRLRREGPGNPGEERERRTRAFMSVVVIKHRVDGNVLIGLGLPHAAHSAEWISTVAPCDGDFGCLGMYFATVVCPIAIPSLSSSPWIRGAPHNGFARLIALPAAP